MYMFIYETYHNSISCASSSEKSLSEDSESSDSLPPLVHAVSSLVACRTCSLVASSVAYFLTYSAAETCKRYDSVVKVVYQPV